MLQKQNYVYAHVDTVTNHALTKGIGMREFSKYIKRVPDNLLLFNKIKNTGEFEKHTGFRMILGQDNVNKYFSSQQNATGSEIEWVDFENLEFVKQLTPVEISEWLYVGHAHHHLHSPFSYKLQNDYIYLTHQDGQLNKTYYRHLDQFYTMLAGTLRDHLEEQVNLQKSFFKKAVQIDTLSCDEVKKIIPLLKEGVAFDFQQITYQNQEHQIPIYLVEDRFKLKNADLSNHEQVGMLSYSSQNPQWQLEMEPL